jgi:hypothetical protein
MRLSLILALSVAMPMFAQQQNPYQDFFTSKTMRVDYFHSGTKEKEWFSLDNIYEESDWPGSRVNLIDTLNLGEYFVRIYDIATNALIFSRGFSTMFNEWQTTDEAGTGVVKTISETVRFPFPKQTVQLTLARRDKRMIFHEVYSTTIDPNSPAQVNREKRQQAYKTTSLMKNGDPAVKVDLVILGDGYAAADMEKFRKDAKHLNDVMFSTEPFKSRKNDFNVWTVEVESKESGIDVPDKGVWKNTALGTRYSTFGLPRYVLTEENKAIRDIASEVPYDFICILLNDSRYGGGGIYNLYSTTYTGEKVAGQEWRSDYMYVHEFGHSFAGLGDEYYSSTTAYNDFYLPGVEPWEPNITALVDKNNVKWKALMAKDAPIPTPWEKAQYDSVQSLWRKLDRQAPDFYIKDTPLLQTGDKILKESKWAGKVGVYEGSGYASAGLYRPGVNCRMFSLSMTDFDPVCKAAIERVIEFYAR